MGLGKYTLKTRVEKRLRKGKLVDPAPVIISLTFAGQRVQVYTPFKVNIQSWEGNQISQDITDKVAGIRAHLLLAYRQLLAGVDAGIITSREVTPEKVRERFEKITGKESQEKAPPVNQTIFEHFERYLTSSTMKDSTKRRIRIVFDHIKSFNPETTIEKVDSQWLDDLKHYFINKGLANISTAKNIKVIKQFLNWATLDGLPVNPKALVYRSKLKIPKPVIIHLTWEELKKLKNWQAPSGTRGRGMDKCRDLFLFASLAGGIRFSDLISLNKDNFKGEKLVYVAGKTNLSIEIPITRTLRTILNKYEGTYRPLPRLSNPGANRIIKDICKDLDFNQEITIVEQKGSQVISSTVLKYDWISFHDARKTFNTIALQRRIPAHVVDELMGHTHPGVKSHYVTVSFEEKKKWMEKLEFEPLLKLKGQKNTGQTKHN